MVRHWARSCRRDMQTSRQNSQMDAFGRSPEEDCNGTMSDPLLQEEQRRLLTGRRPEGLGASPIALRQTRTHSSRCRCRYAQLVVVRLSSGRLDPRFSCRMNTAGLSSMCTNHTLLPQHIVWAHRYPGPSPESPARRLPAEEMRNVYRLRNPKQSTYILDIWALHPGVITWMRLLYSPAASAQRFHGEWRRVWRESQYGKKATWLQRRRNNGSRPKSGRIYSRPPTEA